MPSIVNNALSSPPEMENVIASPLASVAVTANTPSWPSGMRTVSADVIVGGVLLGWIGAEGESLPPPHAVSKHMPATSNTFFMRNSP